ncbi:molybdopterin-dependent oxidoreductase [Halorubrum laminariae]|uniref:Molybdopterin-dependent oxidoreductase n=1 Tax=Halorubrum laminariae TaxID=1433523 RepID=A0ABD6BZV2_9EURY|nr:molybdopterin-dependent oxidoreductase [Halorubrum laminariae]
MSEPVTLDLDRRSFMKASALAGAVAFGGGTTGQVLGQEEESDGVGDDAETAKVICNYCSIGCGFKAVKDGEAFVGQEPWHENPLNNGSLCSKGAGILETEHSERRLKHPMRKEDGEWRKISWDEAYQQIADTYAQTVEQYSPESVMLLGSAHHSNESAYASRKFSAFLGTNNVDHQARICHSTTVTGLANTWGYGAMTNTINDYRNFDLLIIIGQNPAEAHPVVMQHILEGQKRGGTIISIDPRYTKTSAHADRFHRMRPGTDVAIMMGLIKYVRDQGELDEEMIDERTMGWPDVDAELDEYDLETVADITWISEESLEEIGDLVIENQPNIQIEWAMGGTQHNNGTQNIRSYALASLGWGSAARSGGGLQVMRGHANVQGATDLGVESSILPGYYGVGGAGSWEHWTNVWDQSPWTSGEITAEELHDDYFATMDDDLFEKINGESPDSDRDTSWPDTAGNMMFREGLTVARWYEAAIEQSERLNESDLYQPDPVKMAFYWGHSANSISEMDKQRRAMEALDLLVVVDVFPSVAGTLPKEDNVLLLPASSQYEHVRTLTNTNRSVQWSERASPPAHNSKPDLQIFMELAHELGFGEHFDWGSGEAIYNDRSTHEDVVREINLGTRSIGYQQPPEKLQQHVEYDYLFDTDTLRADAPGTPVDGEYWSLPWPYWGGDHPGTPIIWTSELDPRDGGHDFRTNWGTQAPTPDEWDDMGVDKPYPMAETVAEEGETDGLDLLREDFEPEWWDDTIEGVPQYPAFTTTLPDDVTEPHQQSLPQEYALREDRSAFDAAQELNENYGQNHDLDFWQQFDNNQPDPPTGRGKARAVAWNFLDTVPVHREPIESPRPDLVEEWPANGQQTNFWRLDQNNATTQENAMREVQSAQEEMPDGAQQMILTSGRQVEHQGGGAETRNNPLTADLQPHMYAEIHPDVAEEMDLRGGEDHVIIHPTAPEKSSILVKAKVTERPNSEEIFLPYHWGGVFSGQSQADAYPEGTKPLAIGDSANIVTASGFDVETQMQETKAGMVVMEKATETRVEELDMEFIDYPQDEAGIGRQKSYDTREWDMSQESFGDD